MNKIEFKNNNHNQPLPKYLTFQPRNHSRQYNKSKSNKKNHINKNIITPCQPLGDKLLKAQLQKNQRKIFHNRRQKTQQSLLQTSMTLDPNKCFNHPDKKGQYFIQSQPNKKFCLKCNLSLNGGNNSTFITKQKYLKKQTLDNFKQELIELKQQIENNKQKLHLSIEQSQQNFSAHSSYINESFVSLKQQIEQKRRQLLNNLILAQQNMKKMYQDNYKKLKKMGKSLQRYQFDIKKFYDQIIQELPKSEFDHIMEEYQQKINKNFKDKLKSILCQDGICVYIPNVQMKNIIEKSRVQFYQPVSERQDQKDLHSSFYNSDQNPQQKRTGSNSLDSKMNDLMSNAYLDKKPTQFKLPEKRKQIDLNLFEKRTGNFISQNEHQQYKQRLIQDKQNINLQNYAHDYFNYKNDHLGKFTFKA